MENCPYCNFPQEINHDDGYGYDEGKIFKQDCENCHHTFTFTTTLIEVHTLDRADCLNDHGDHHWEETTGYPLDIFLGKEHCVLCGEERQL